MVDRDDADRACATFTSFRAAAQEHGRVRAPHGRLADVVVAPQQRLTERVAIEGEARIEVRGADGDGGYTGDLTVPAVGPGLWRRLSVSGLC